MAVYTQMFFFQPKMILDSNLCKEDTILKVIKAITQTAHRQKFAGVSWTGASASEKKYSENVFYFFFNSELEKKSLVESYITLSIIFKHLRKNNGH